MSTIANYYNNDFFSNNQQVVKFVLSNRVVEITVKSITSKPVSPQNQYGVDIAHAKEFISALKNHQVKGYRTFRNYVMPGRSASVHADTFLWNIL